MEDNQATLAFPETRLEGERLWVSSALSVLRANVAKHSKISSATFHYQRAIFAMEGLLETFDREAEQLACVGSPALIWKEPDA